MVNVSEEKNPEPARGSSENLQVDLEGSLIYHGATSIYRAHLGVPARGNASPSRELSANYVVGPDSNFEHVAEHFGINLNDELVDDALMQFFKWQYPHFMFIYREAFLRDHFGDRTRGKYWSSALLLSICALGTLMSPEKRHRNASEQFFSAAESILIVSGFTKPSIVTVQGFLCLAFYEIGRGNLSKGWGFSGRSLLMILSSFTSYVILNMIVSRNRVSHGTRYGFSKGPETLGITRCITSYRGRFGDSQAHLLGMLHF